MRILLLIGLLATLTACQTDTYPPELPDPDAQPMDTGPIDTSPYLYSNPVAHSVHGR